MTSRAVCFLPPGTTVFTHGETQGRTRRSEAVAPCVPSPGLDLTCHSRQRCPQSLTLVLPSGGQGRGGSLLLSLHLFPELLLQLLLPELPLERGFALRGAGGQASAAGDQWGVGGVPSYLVNSTQFPRGLTAPRAAQKVQVEGGAEVRAGGRTRSCSPCPPASHRGGQLSGSVCTVRSPPGL